MGLIDNMTLAIGRGMNAAEGKTQGIRLKAELSGINKSLDAAFASLGRAIYMSEDSAATVKAVYAEQCVAIERLLSQEATVRHQIEEIQRAELARTMQPTPIQQYQCPTCGCPVTLSSPTCPRCGDNLAALKVNFRMCPKCGSYYSSDYQFCENDGTRTVEIPVAETVSPHTPEMPASLSDDAGANGFVSLGGEGTVCPNCHQPVLSGSAFCGNCGAKI